MISLDASAAPHLVHRPLHWKLALLVVSYHSLPPSKIFVINSMSDNVVRAAMIPREAPWGHCPLVVAAADSFN